MHKRRVAAFSLGALVTCAGLEVGLAAKTKGASVEKMEVVRLDGKREVPVTVRIDTPIEVEYYRAGGILPFVLRRLIATRS